MVKKLAIVEKAANAKTYLGTQKLTPFQMIWVVIGIFFFIFMDTDIFNEFPDMLKIVLYASFMLICILLGVSIFNMKKIAADMKAIYEDTNMTPLQKVNAYGNLALNILSRLGEAFELLNNEQFKQPVPEIKEDI